MKDPKTVDVEMTNCEGSSLVTDEKLKKIYKKIFLFDLNEKDCRRNNDQKKVIMGNLLEKFADCLRAEKQSLSVTTYDRNYISLQKESLSLLNNCVRDVEDEMEKNNYQKIIKRNLLIMNYLFDCYNRLYEEKMENDSHQLFLSIIIPLINAVANNQFIEERFIPNTFSFLTSNLLFFNYRRTTQFFTDYSVFFNFDDNKAITILWQHLRHIFVTSSNFHLDLNLPINEGINGSVSYRRAVYQLILELVKFPVGNKFPFCSMVANSENFLGDDSMIWNDTSGLDFILTSALSPIFNLYLNSIHITNNKFERRRRDQHRLANEQIAPIFAEIQKFQFDILEFFFRNGETREKTLKYLSKVLSCNKGRNQSQVYSLLNPFGSLTGSDLFFFNMLSIAYQFMDRIKFDKVDIQYMHSKHNRFDVEDDCIRILTETDDMKNFLEDFQNKEKNVKPNFHTEMFFFALHCQSLAIKPLMSDKRILMEQLGRLESEIQLAEEEQKRGRFVPQQQLLSAKRTLKVRVLHLFFNFSNTMRKSFIFKTLNYRKFG
ncbi:hypothetical protein SNEBB_004939 [Seison nebaliae]|nr:hypothetical protein SNEBB_004939 [Seison nebaliae]